MTHESEQDEKEHPTGDELTAEEVAAYMKMQAVMDQHLYEMGAVTPPPQPEKAAFDEGRSPEERQGDLTFLRSSGDMAVEGDADTNDKPLRQATVAALEEILQQREKEHQALHAKQQRLLEILKRDLEEAAPSPSDDADD